MCRVMVVNVINSFEYVTCVASCVVWGSVQSTYHVAKANGRNKPKSIGKWLRPENKIPYSMGKKRYCILKMKDIRSGS